MGKFFALRQRGGPSPVERNHSVIVASRTTGTRASQPTDDLTWELMNDLRQAIEGWQRRNALEALPVDVVIEQSLVALNEMHRLSLRDRDEEVEQ